MSNKFSVGDSVVISNFPDTVYKVLDVRKLLHDREYHYCLEKPVIWVSESSLEKVNPPMVKCWEYTINDVYRERDSVLAVNENEALKLIFAKHSGAKIYPVGGKWGGDVNPC